MNKDSKKQWFVVYARSGCEKRVSDLLERRQIETYIPYTRTCRPWTDRKKVSLQPLFTSYVFVYTSPDQHPRIKQTEGIINFVHWLNMPAIIHGDEIATIRKFVREYECVKLEKTPINLDDSVRIVNGPLMMWEGNVVEIRTKTVKITLPSLGYSLVAEISKTTPDSVMSLQELKMKAG